MKIKMRETFQGSGVSAFNVTENMNVGILEPGEVYEVDSALGDYLLEHRKAERVEDPKPAHYGAQPELRKDDEIYPVPMEAKRKRGKHETDKA